MESKEKVLRVLKDAGQPLRPGDIAQKSGVAKDEVAKVVKQLKAEGKIVSPKTCFYAIKK